MKKILIPLLILAYTTTVTACINGSGINIFGEETTYDEPFAFIKGLRKPMPKAQLKKRMDKLKSKIDNHYYAYDAIDLSVYLIYDNQLDSAITILNEVVKKDGYSYSVYSNLGVAYELKGDLDSAYYFTKRGVEENPESHYGSEWIHLKILEAQMEINKDPKWIINHYVLGHKISNDSIPTALFDNNNNEMQKLAIEIEYQLRERMYFVKPENKIVGQLLLQLSDIFSLSVDIENALGTYMLAKQYDPDLTAIIDKRIAKIKSILNPVELASADSLIATQNPDTTENAQKKIEEPSNPETKVEKKKENSNFIWFILGGTLIVLLIARFRILRNQQKKK